ncbi:SRPBCC family protein [Lacrimispora brassicae]
MYQYENTSKGKVDVSKVWDLYSNVNRWQEFDLYIEKVELEGAFVIGSKGTIYMTGMPPLPFTLEEIVENKKYMVTSQLGDITVLLGHEILTEKDSDIVTIKHTVTMTGAPDEELKAMSEGIVSPIPEITQRIISLTKIN